MSRLHEQIQEEAILLALGHTPDIPVITIVEHLAGCAECSELLRDVTEASGKLPEALEHVHPPAHLRENILRLAALDNASLPTPERALDASGERPTALTQPKKRRSLLGQWRLTSTGTLAWTMALVVTLIVGNGVLWWRTQSQHKALAAMEARYASDLNWLKSAEYLLVSGEAPAYSGHLRHPETADQQPTTETAGKFAVYHTAQARVYLLIQANGLSEDTPHTVWIHEDGEKRLVGDFVSTPTGGGSYVYTTDAADWERLASSSIILGVRDERTQQPVLLALLGDPSAI